MDLDIKAGLVSKLPEKIVDELLTTYKEAKSNFFLGGHRLQSVEGGRFCEAAIRLLEVITTGTHTPLGRTLPTMDDLLRKFSNFPHTSFPDSVRLHIPRALRVVYDIRNLRDAAHLGDGIDPNIQDATLVCAILDWVLAELVRLYHSVSPDNAQKIVDDLVTRKAPIVQSFDGFPKVLKPNLLASNHCLVVLYHASKTGASFQQLNSWVPPKMRKNLRRTLDGLEHDKKFIHGADDKFEITRAGQKFVEDNAFFE